ncbi:hypothetical protein AB0O82_09195 [Kitasatospora sp. NPDC088264]|uniref:hypothetical protein n=1 Tax=Kitasatospora sp. NPDC088264 TaxID=3155296 RepID=UPI0034251D33
MEGEAVEQGGEAAGLDGEVEAGRQGAGALGLRQDAVDQLTRQGARKKWPEARPAAPPGGLELFGGTAELEQDAESGGWRWVGVGADGVRGAADCGYPTKEEAAARAGAFLGEHAAP